LSKLIKLQRDTDTENLLYIFIKQSYS